MHLIGIHGKARAGKDTVAAYLSKQHGFLRNAFADPLKRAAQQMFGLTEAETTDDNLKEVVIPYWGMSPRQMFQKLGTEGGREVFGDELWLKRWRKFYLDFSGKAHIVVPDVRFENEAAMIRSLGGMILHLTSDRGNNLSSTAKAHASEAGIPRMPGDLLIDNSGTYQQLYAKVDEMVDWLDSSAGVRA